MNTTIINIRTQNETKKAAQSVADDLGLSLSALINGFLKQLIKTKSISLDLSEKPSRYLIQAINESRKNIENGEISPGFSNTKDMVSWLSTKNKKYGNTVHKKVL